MRIHCIHDPRRTDRYKLLQQEIEIHELDLQLWPAIEDPVRTFRGVNLAHKQIVRWAAMQNLPNICIAEDDFHLTAPGAWKHFLDNLPEVFDLYLSGVYFGQINEDRTIRDFCGLHLYIVNQRFYRTFLQITESNNLDRALGMKGRYIVCTPFAAVQHPGWSDNKKGFAKYDHLLVGRELYGIGKVKPPPD